MQKIRFLIIHTNYNIRIVVKSFWLDKNYAALGLDFLICFTKNECTESVACEMSQSYP